MTRLLSALRLELTLQNRQKFLHAAVFSGLIWLAVLLPMPHSLRPVAEPYILLGDIAIIGFFFIGGIVFFEKQERTLSAVISTPLRFWEYLTAKLTVLLMISLACRDCRGHYRPRVRLPSRAARCRRRPWHPVDAVGGIHHLPAVHIGERLVHGRDHPACRDVGTAGPAVLRRVDDAGAVPDTHTGTASAARGGVRSGGPDAMAGRLRGGVSRTVGSGIVLGGQGSIRQIRHRKVRCVVSSSNRACRLRPQ